MSQAILGSLLNRPGDGACGYYRSRPFMLSVGLDLDDAMAGPLVREGGMSDGRDIGVVFNKPEAGGACVLPMSGGVGTQYTPVVGWAQALKYKVDVLKQEDAAGCISLHSHG